jgi:hypothetical protein
MQKLKNKLLESFRLGGPKGDCYEFTGLTNTHGYGRIKCNRIEYQTHRLSYELWIGAIPEKMLVCHSCDNRKCFRPAHLWLGSPRDNANDMKQKGRAHKGIGESNPMMKLLADQVRSIKLSQQPSTELARQYGVHRNTIIRIRNGSRRTGE